MATAFKVELKMRELIENCHQQQQTDNKPYQKLYLSTYLKSGRK